MKAINRNNIRHLERNLKEIVTVLNTYRSHVWPRKYPPVYDDFYFKNAPEQFIDKINHRKEFVLYIHVPFCADKCDYCTYHSPGDIDELGSKNYVNCLKQELNSILNSSDRRKILCIYFGGGTPTLLKMKDLKDLMDYIYKNFEVSRNASITIEGTPNSITKEAAKTLIECGITKVVLGVQTFNEKKLKFVERLFQNNHDVYKSVEYLRKAGHHNISFDLIYGLFPNESIKEFLNDNLEHIINLQPQSLSIYPLQNYKKFPKAVYDFPTKNSAILRDFLNPQLKHKDNFILYNYESGKKGNSVSFHDQYYYLRWVILEDTLAIGLGSAGNLWMDNKFCSRTNRHNAKHDLDGYKEDAQKISTIKYHYGLLAEEPSLRRHLIWNFHNSWYGVQRSVIRRKFPKTQELFYKMMDEIKDVLTFTSDKIVLNDDYEKVLPFKTKNGYVNYFIFVFCYLYSESDQEKLLMSIR